MHLLSVAFERRWSLWSLIAVALSPGRIALMVAMLLVTSGRAEVLFSEEFPYQNGFLEEVSGGKWTRHSGDANEIEVAEGLVGLTQAKSEDVNALLAGMPHTQETTPSLYLKFVLRLSKLPSATGGYFLHLKGTSASSGFRTRIWALAGGAEAGSYRLGISSISSSAPTAVHERDLQLDTDYTIVASLQLADGTSSLWIDPASEFDLSINGDSGESVSIIALALRQGSGMGILTLDNLTVATTFAEALSGQTTNEGPPQIIAQPENRAVTEGSSVTFHIKAGGALPLSYQWQFNGADLNGETSASLTLNSATSAVAGEYQVVVSNAEGAVTSDPATLIVNPPIPGEGKPPLLLFTNTLDQLVRPGDALTSTNLTEYALRPNEKLTIQAVIRDPSGRNVSVRAVDHALPSHVSWDIPQAVGPEVSATLSFVAEASDVGDAFEAQLEASNGDATNRVTWKIYVPTAIEQQMVISEFLANPTANAASPHYNPLRRKTPSSSSRVGVEDEYVEIVNLSPESVDLQDWTLSDSAVIRHVFGGLDFIQSSNAVVVYGGKQTGSEPRLGPGIFAAPASRGTSGLGLNNTRDSILLRNARGRLVSRVAYVSSLLKTNASVTRSPDLDGPFFNHLAASGLHSSPGLGNDELIFGDGTSSGPPLKLIATFGAGFSIVLRWNVQTNRVYSVLRSASPAGPYEAVATGLQFDRIQGSFPDPDAAITPHRFYKIRSP